MLLSNILSGIEYQCDNFIDFDIKDVTYNSKNAGDGKCFVCLVGTVSDGHSYALDAYNKGCRCIFTQRKLELPSDCVQIVTPDTRRTLAAVSSNFFGNPCDSLTIIGITGTKGKTTTAHLIKTLIEACGENCGLIGTLGAMFGDTVIDTLNTTPESYELHKIFRRMVDAGCRFCVMEASSLGLKMHRTDAIKFNAGVFTNLSPDHIGTVEHPTFEDYAQSKKLLFKYCSHAIVNADDPSSEYMLEGFDGERVTFGLSNADFTAENVTQFRSKDFFGITFDCISKDETIHIEVPVPGYFNVYNVLAAVAVCKMFGFDIKNHVDSLRDFKVIGRTEIVRVNDDYDVIIDFAHNGLSMHSLLSTLKTYPHNRLIVLYGAIGEKNQIRRSELGTVTGKEADLSILTSEDPGKEDPLRIAEEIAGYIRQVGGKYIIIEDRKEAIRYALSHLEKGDILVLAGKGNEKFMKTNNGKVPYSEHEEVQKYIDSISK